VQRPWERGSVTAPRETVTLDKPDAALAGYLEALLEDDAEKNRLCPPAPTLNTTADWAAHQVLGSRASSFGSYPTIRESADDPAARAPAWAARLAAARSARTPRPRR
jgi:hypothetical protein